MGIVIKRRGHEEPFDERKIYGAVYAASLNAHRPKELAEKTAEEVCGRLRVWIEEQKGATSDGIFKKVTQELKEIDPEAGFMFETHRDIS